MRSSRSSTVIRIPWAAERNIEFVLAKGKFKAGDKVVYTNEFGVSFENMEILGFEKNGGLVYLNKHAYWYPIPLPSLSFEVPEPKIKTIMVGDLKLTSIGFDDWSRQLYKGSDGRTYVDADGIGKVYTISNWGEPMFPIN